MTEIDSLAAAKSSVLRRLLYLLNGRSLEFRNTGHRSPNLFLSPVNERLRANVRVRLKLTDRSSYDHIKVIIDSLPSFGDFAQQLGGRHLLPVVSNINKEEGF